MSAIELLERQLAANDLALDFVEHEVGCYDFAKNWAAVKVRECPVKKIDAWLKAIGAQRAGLAAEISDNLDQLAKDAPTWLAPYSRKLG